MSPPGGRPRLEWLWWVLAAASAAGALAAHASSWLGHNGDHYYYTSATLQYAGWDYTASLRATTDHFPYPFDTFQLDYGHLNPGVAPLIYPRTTLEVLALPGVHLRGVPGIYTAGLACGVVSLVVLVAWTRRRVGPTAALALPTLALGTAYASEFMFGIYSEAPLICAVTLMLVAFPLNGDHRLRQRAVAAAGLVPLMMLSRQVPLLPVGMVVGGWLWTAVGTRSLRNPWNPYLVTVVPTTVVSYGLIAIWAPYDVVPFLLESTRTATVDELLRTLPSLWWDGLRTDLTFVWDTDKPVLALAVLVVAGTVVAFRTPLAGVFLGSLISGSATFLANGHANQFRYLSPSLPMALVLAGLACTVALRRLRRRSWHPQLRPSTTSRLAPAGTVTAWLASATVVAATVLLNQSTPIDGAHSARIDQASLSTWPLTVRSGTLACSGNDYEIWFTDDHGTRYAVSGTAMKRSFGRPTINAVWRSDLRQSWASYIPLLRAGMHLCDPSGRTYQAAR